jgi:uncharacterized membrane protein
MMALLRKWIVAGLLVWIPLGVTLLVVRAVVGVLDASLLLLPQTIRPSTPGIGILLSVVLVLGTGALTANLIGREMLRWSELALARIPLVRSVYGAMKKLTETVFSGSGQSFREAVLIQWPRQGVWTVGFITGTPVGEVTQKTTPDAVTVLVPTTPNPTSGFLVVVSRSELRKLDMGVERAMRLVISLGVVSQEDKPEAPKPG